MATKERSKKQEEAAPRRPQVPQRQSLKVGRNSPCPCGSGQKYKSCCASKGDAYLKKLERRRESAQLKEDGVPWYLRLLR